MLTQPNLTSAYTTLDAKLAWTDPKIERYAAHMEHVLGVLATLKGVPGPAAKYARDAFTAERQRVNSILSVDRSTALESARAAALAALAAFRLHDAAPRPTDVDAEVRRVAERNILSRAVTAAGEAFIAAAQASVLPGLYWPRREAEAIAQTKSLVGASRERSPASWEIGFAHRSVDMAIAMGKSLEPETAVYLAVAEHPYRGEPDAEELFAGRWFHWARRQPGLEAAAWQPSAAAFQ